MAKRQKKYTALEVLKTTNAVIRIYGWKSKSATVEDDFNAVATYQIVDAILHGENTQANEWREEVQKREVDVTDRLVAERVIQWIDDGYDTDQSYRHYLYECSLVVKKVERSSYAMLCSAINSFKNEQIRLIKYERTYSNHYCGNIGDRKRRELVLDQIIRLNNNNNNNKHFDKKAVLYKFVDDCDNLFVWFSKNDKNLRSGKAYSFISTIAEHSSFSGMKQNKINRVVGLRET